ncbi:hypothetical protein BDN72DRAFT_200462 [Pluteus cervinus]|uniref:Uncharacterized protein n=1 Tax=Pluteus cervinus TaxID=181527 RepID=A0ACD3B5K8_9AGAR|nr:hypothetical protein BDN72DRAFT_200462 [Pluteus cervinus]
MVVGDLSAILPGRASSVLVTRPVFHLTLSGIVASYGPLQVDPTMHSITVLCPDLQKKSVFPTPAGPTGGARKMVFVPASPRWLALVLKLIVLQREAIGPKQLTSRMAPCIGIKRCPSKVCNHVQVSKGKSDLSSWSDFYEVGAKGQGRVTETSFFQ